MKKGFTLVELLAVIIILGVLAVIIVPPVMENVDKTKEAAFEGTMKNISLATQLYIRDNKDTITGINEVDNIIYIPLQDVVDAENLSTPITDARTDKVIDLTTQIKVVVKARNKYTITIDNIIYK